jgi:hypothetical protein
MDAAAWRKRAEEYRAMAAKAATEVGRRAWLKLAESCDRNAADARPAGSAGARGSPETKPGDPSGTP